MPFPRSWLLLLVVLAWSGLCLAAQDAEGPLSPHVTSVFPLGGQQGTRVEAEVRGLALDGAYAAWFDGSGLRADIGRVEEVAPPESESGATEGPGGREGGQPGHRVRLRVSIDGSALPGVYALRLISPRGISNPLPFAVGTESVILEAPTPHHRPADAQPVNFPVVIYGRVNSAIFLSKPERARSCFSRFSRDPLVWPQTTNTLGAASMPGWVCTKLGEAGSIPPGCAPWR